MTLLTSQTRLAELQISSHRLGTYKKKTSKGMFPISDRENHLQISLRKNLYQNSTVVIIGMSE